jgi:putative ABC transport system permease protein
MAPGIALAAAGVGVGSLLARGMARTLQHFLWGVKPTDPATFVAVALGLLSVAALASVIPALRIARLNPAETLRNE